MNGQVQEALRIVNYRRRIRSLTEDDVVQVLDEARRRGVGWHRAGTVATAYRQKASTAAVACVRVKEEFYVCFGAPDAHVHSSDVTWFGPKSRRDRDVDEWRMKVANDPEFHLNYWIHLSRREVLTLLQTRKAKALAHLNAIIADIPDVEITVQHSLDAGNCPQETSRVAKAFHGMPTSARTVAAKFPELAPFIKRAAEVALRK